MTRERLELEDRREAGTGWGGFIVSLSLATVFIIHATSLIPVIYIIATGWFRDKQ